MDHVNKFSFEDVAVGSGPEAVKGALCFVNFVGRLQDGTVFDSTDRHGRPFEFVLGSKKVIAGWSEACKGMRPGGRRKAFVPASLGYGDRVVGAIPANSDLYYEIQMLEVRLRE